MNKIVARIISIILCGILVLGLVAVITSCDDKEPAPPGDVKGTVQNAPSGDADTDTANSEPDKEGTMNTAKGYVYSEQVTEYVDILMDSGEHIVVKLMPEVAPLTVENFQNLVKEGFYDGLIFHRVIDGFMIQGGDPEGTGMGGADKQIKGEFAINGFDNKLSHKRGVISMARSQNPNSASSQFFICNGDSEFLDGQYAAFGETVLGMEEVDRIAKLEKNPMDRPLDPPAMEKVFFVKPE